MTSEYAPQIAPVFWTEAEPARLEVDKADVLAFAPDLEYVEPNDGTDGGRVHHGAWAGTLPIWPFARPQPDEVEQLLDGVGLKMELQYPAAYPMVPPSVIPVSPVPEVIEQTQQRWHVLPGGGLCLLQSDGAWSPEASVTDLLSKASGWRIEYALMKAGAIDAMSVCGIVNDDSIDHLIAEALTRRQSVQEGSSEDPGPMAEGDQ